MSLLTPAIGPGDHLIGSLDAPVALLEFGDYECPYCARAAAVVAEVLRRMGGRVLYAFRHYPLTRLHPQALAAAGAAEAAGAQGKFWPMHRMLFDNQDALEVADLVGYAEAPGLDLDRFAAGIEDEANAHKVRSDVASGLRSGVEGTPTFYVDGVRHDGSWDVDALVAALEAALDGKDAGEGAAHT